MHAIFMLYGRLEDVNRLIRDMSAQKHILRMKNSEGTENNLWIEGQVRFLPFGIYEYVFPKEDLDAVLTTLDFHKKAPYNLNKVVMSFIRNVLKAKKAPKFNSEKKLLWLRENVSIIPIGVRYDKDIDDNGWIHEGI